MKAKTICIIAVALISFPAISQKKAKLKTRTDSISYAIGVSMFEGTKQINHELDLKKISQGMMHASEEKAAMDLKAAQTYIQKVEQELKQDIAFINKEKEKAFLAENRNKEGVIETESGLQYEVLTEGSGSKPSASDRVKVHYEGFLLDGSKFDSSVDRDEPAVFGVMQVIQGWTEVLQLMPEGSKYRVYIPAELGYGDRQMGSDIPAASTLVFDIELLEIVSQ